MAIDPISLPSAAGIDYGEGDVRHFSEGDAVGVPGLSAPTRHLAQRDTLLASKLNEVISDVNNKEQIITLPVYRTVLPSSAEEVIANFRIAPGYEARILNAIISSNPVSSDTELNVMWANGFGNVSGSVALTTASEASGGTKFWPTGEFIIQVKNKGDVTLDVVANVILTLRPISGVTSALLPAPSVAPPGPPGRQGDKGEKGDAGLTGPPGSPGLQFKGQWTETPYPVTYSVNDVVTHDFAGTSGFSSYVCLVGHTANGVNQPQPSLVPTPYWDYISQAGGQGVQGNDGASGTSGVTFNTFPIQGTLWTSSDFKGDHYNGLNVYNGTYDSTATTPGRKYLITFIENTAVGADNISGNAVLSYTTKVCYTGTLGFVLPSVAFDGAFANYTCSDVHIDVAMHGTNSGTIGVMRTGPIGDENGYNVIARDGRGFGVPMWINLRGQKTR